MTRFLLIDADDGPRHDLARVLEGAGASIETAPSHESARPGPYDVIVANADSLGVEKVAAVLKAYPDLRARGRVLLVTGVVDRHGLARLFGEHGLSNVLARDANLDGDELLVTVQKILRGDLFGLDKYFSEVTARRDLAIRSSTQREGLLADAREFAISIGAPGRFADLLCNACDELVTNALYNAPVDADGRHRYAALPRTTAVELGPDEEVKVTLIFDGRRIGIAVLDVFGSLEATTITQYLAKCLRRGEDQVDEKAGGAGLGLFYVFEAVSHFVVNIEPGRRTETIGLLDITRRYKDFVSRPKSVNIFVAPHG